MRFRFTVVGVSASFFSIWLFGCLHGDFAQQELERKRTAQILQHCESLKLIELHAYLHKLGDRRDLKTLTAICYSGSRCNHCAAPEIVRIIDAEEAVDFCRSFPIDSLHWLDAFFVLDYHPKDKVIGYVKEVMHSRIPRVRYYGYLLCLRAGWDDLLPYAKQDQYDTSFVGFVPNRSEDDWTLDQTARKYIAKFAVCKDKQEVSATEKRAFLKLLETLPTKGEFFTEEAINKIMPHTRVLLALTREDVAQYAKERGEKGEDFMYGLAAVSGGLMDRRRPREYGIKHFSKIAHPEIKLFWAAGLFDREVASPEIIKFLRAALASKEQSKLLEGMLGPGFGHFKKRVKEYPGTEKK